MAEFNDKIIEMGCDFWIDTEEECSLGRNPYDRYTTLVGHNKRRNIQNKITQRNTRKVL